MELLLLKLIFNRRLDPLVEIRNNHSVEYYANTIRSEVDVRSIIDYLYTFKQIFNILYL